MGYVYELFGWNVFLIMLAAIGGVGALCMWFYGRMNQRLGR
jgi:YNFM family putative membrane transporter